MQKLQFLWKYEKYIFGTIVFIFLIPILGIKFFPTVDGPAHLYNGNLLNQLWFQGQSEVIQFFDVNKNLEPNWINHIWFALLSSMFQSFLVEKSVLLFYIIALPYSFRLLIQTAVEGKQETRLSSYLIFPFVYSFPFCIGFLNFCIGIPMLFFCISFWIKNRETFNFLKILLLVLFTTILYFTHLFIFLFFGMIILIFELVESWKTKELKQGLKNIFFLFLSTLPGILFSVIFVLSNQSYEASKYISKQKLLEGLYTLSPIITLNYEKEKIFAFIILFALCSLLIMALYNNIVRIKQNGIQRNFVWIICAIILLVFYFIFPDWMVSGGFISIRLALFFFLFLITWIATSNLSTKQMAIPLIIIISTSLCFVAYHYRETKKLSDDAEEILLAESRIERGKILLPLNYSENWIQGNFSNYIGAHKFIIVLDNYEATKPHFPLLWKESENPYKLIGNFGNINPCIRIEKYEQSTGHKIDYISRWCYTDKMQDSCAMQTAKVIESKFDLIYTSPHKKLQLFKRKKETKENKNLYLKPQ